MAFCHRGTRCLLEQQTWVEIIIKWPIQFLHIVVCVSIVSNYPEEIHSTQLEVANTKSNSLTKKSFYPRSHSEMIEVVVYWCEWVSCIEDLWYLLYLKDLRHTNYLDYGKDIETSFFITGAYISWALYLPSFPVSALPCFCFAPKSRTILAFSIYEYYYTIITL